MQISKRAKEMKELAERVQDVVARNSAGEMSRRQNWEFFVRNVRSDFTIMELTLECVNAMSDDQRRRLLATLESQSK